MKLKLKDGDLDLPSNESAAARYLADMFYSSGRVPDDDRKVPWGEVYDNFSPRIQDTTTTSDVRPLLQSSLEIIIREPVEPLMTITGLYNRVESRGMNTQVLAGSLGAVTADDIPEHGTYPEVFFQVGGGMQTAHVGKAGIACAFTDEVLRYSTWDIMSMNMRLMGNALVRHKEQKAISFLKTLGTELYNNAAPQTSIFGVTTGRGMGMQANGSMDMDDLFKAMAHMAEEGFHPDTLLINPLYFYSFIQDPVLRTMMINHGGGSWFQQWNGQPGPRDPWSNGSMGSRGPSLGNRISRTPGEATGIRGREHGMTSTPPMPTSYFPWAMNVVISPFVPFDPETQLGDVFLLSTGNVGFHLVDETPVTVEWRDENVDSVKLKIRERYGFAVSHEGQGVGVMKNIKLARNRFNGVVQAATLDVDSEIDPDADLDL